MRKFLRYFVAVTILLVARSATGAVTFGQASSGNTGASLVTNWTYNVVVPSGTNTVAFVALCTANGVANDVTLAKINGADLTLVGDASSSGGSIAHVYLFQRIAPTVGTVPVEFTIGTARIQASGTIVLHGVNQTTPAAGAQSAANSSATSSISVNVTTATGEMIVDAGCKRHTGEVLTMTAQSNRTQRYNVQSSSPTAGNNVILGGSTQTGTGSFTMQWSGTTNRGFAASAANAPAAQVGVLSLGFKLLR